MSYFRWLIWRLAAKSKSLPRAPLPTASLPYATDEFADLLRSDNPDALKKLAAGLARPHPDIRTGTGP